MFLQDYEKIRRLGQGGFASVYKVRHAQLGYVRALKVSNQFIEDTEDRAWKSFVNECKVLLQIGNGSHPNIVRIYQPRLLDNRAVVEMDCVEGESMSSYIRGERFIPADEFFRFAVQVVGAMAFCHVDIYRFMMNPAEDRLDPDPADGRKFLISPEKERELIKKYGVVHNDLHSGNIMRRDYDGQYILLDFGLAIQDSHCVKSSSRFDGAIEYCSPEKLEQGHVSTRSDVYALGILLYEMLTGEVPFPLRQEAGTSPESARTRVYMAHLQEEPPMPLEGRKRAFEAVNPGKEYERDYPELLDELLMRCLEKDPEKRYADARELQAALRRCEQLWYGMSKVEALDHPAGDEPREPSEPQDTPVPPIPVMMPDMDALRRELHQELSGMLRGELGREIDALRRQLDALRREMDSLKGKLVESGRNARERERLSEPPPVPVIPVQVEDPVEGETGVPPVPGKGVMEKHDPADSLIDDVEFVDLGLSVRWADRNIGAQSPLDFGKFVDKDLQEDLLCFSTFNLKGAKIPTLIQWEELCKKCRWELTGNGYRVFGKNGNSIFLPFNGESENSFFHTFGRLYTRESFFNFDPTNSVFYYFYFAGGVYKLTKYGMSYRCPVRMVFQP